MTRKHFVIWHPYKRTFVSAFQNSYKNKDVWSSVAIIKFKNQNNFGKVAERSRSLLKQQKSVLDVFGSDEPPENSGEKWNIFQMKMTDDALRYISRSSLKPLPSLAPQH